MLDSYFYPGFFTDAQKQDIARRELAYVIKNFVVRCDSIPKLIGYTSDSSQDMAYFCDPAGVLIGAVSLDKGYEGKFTLWTHSRPMGDITGFNVSQYAESAKVNYIVSAITKERARGSSPLTISRRAGNAISNTLSEIVGRFRDVAYVSPGEPAVLNIKEMAHLTPVILENQSVLSVPQAVMAKVERIHKYIHKATDLDTQWQNSVNEMFANEKWVVMPRTVTSRSSFAITVGAVRLSDNNKADLIKHNSSYTIGPKVEVTTPFTTYPSINEVPNDLLTSMAINQHFIRASSMSSFVKTTDDYIPAISQSAFVWPEINAMSINTSYNWQLYLLDK
jgi:hypothetical protein